MEFRKITRTRCVIIFAILFLITGFFMVRFIQIQIIAGEDYKNLSKRQTSREVSVEAARGEIVDRYGRPLVSNRMGFNAVFDYAFIDRDNLNDTIFKLINIFEDMSYDYIDTLPIEFMQESYVFAVDRENDIKKLKQSLKLQDYATPDNVITAMTKKYKLEQSSYSKEDIRKILSVRYGMEEKDFSMANSYIFSSDIEIEMAQKIMENSAILSGVNVIDTAVREYVGGDLAPHLLGVIGPIYEQEYKALKDKGYKLNDNVGKSGIELAYEDVLRGENGTRQIITDVSGNVVAVNDVVEAQAGNTVVLTIDKDLQRVAQDSLEKQIKYLNEQAVENKGKEADVGAVAVIEVKTGEILALASYPSYDINDYLTDYGTLLNDPLNPLFNRAIQGSYAPGSTYKPVTGIAGLNEDILDAQDTVFCGRYYNFFSDYRPTCLGYHGNVTIHSALNVSCNIYFYEVGRLVGIERLESYSKLFGFGEPTGIEIPENKGQMTSKALKEERGGVWNPGDILQVSIGQSETMASPLQLANLYATIARDGTRLETHLVKSIKSYDLVETVEETQPIVASQLDVPKSIFDTVNEALLGVSRTGTARAVFANYPIDVSSKTGTPETIDLPNSVFTAYAPSNDPEIAVCIVIEKGWHGYTGAPVARDIFDQYFFSKFTKGEYTHINELLK